MSEESSEETDSDDEEQHCVFDNGSGLTKVGFSGDDAPLSVFPTIVGRPRDKDTMPPDSPDFYYGEEVKQKRGVLFIRYPVEHGIITSWDDMEHLWQLCFKEELKVEPEEHCTLLTEPPLHPKCNREKMTQIMIEQHNVPGIYLAQQPVLALYASGRTTGTVVSVGDGTADIVPVYEGYALPHAIPRMNISGRDITWQLQRLLSEQGYSFYTSGDRDIVNAIKEKLGYIAFDYDAELKVPTTAEPKLAVFQEYYATTKRTDRVEIMDEVFGRNISRIVHQYLPQSAEQDFAFQSMVENAKETTYELPDGKLITVGNQRFRATEILFNPAFCGREEPGLMDHLNWSIMRCDEEIRKDLYGNVLLSGGSTLFHGFAQRVEKELKSRAPASTKVNVIAPPKRHLSAWIGGSILSSLSTFQSMWLTKDEYDESGPALIHKKCF